MLSSVLRIFSSDRLRNPIVRQKQKLKERKQLAQNLGERYYAYAAEALDRGELTQATYLVREGLYLASGAFYLVVQDQLRDLRSRIEAEKYG